MRPAKQRPPKKAASLGYVALHSSDLMICIAGGFLRGRNLPDGSSNLQSKGAGLAMATHLPVPASHVAAARGAIEYGSVTVLEVELGLASPNGLVPDKEARLELPIPLAWVRRALFRTEAERKEFVARATAYADIPPDILILKVKPGAFSPETQADLVLSAQPIGTAESLSNAVPDALDKVAGALAAVLAAMRLQPGPAATRVLDHLVANAPRMTSPGDIAAGVANLLDPGYGSRQHDNAALVRAAAGVLGSMHTTGGFDATVFLNAIAGGIDGATDAQRATIETFARYAKDIVNARREISQDQFLDVAGKVATRALLLFVLHHEPDRLLAIPKRVPNLGQSVFLVTSILAGSFAGLANLPAELKAASKSAFLGVGLLAFQALRGQALAIEVKKKWDTRGNGHAEFVFMGHTLLMQESQAPAALVKAFEILDRLALRPKFATETGTLTASLDRDTIARSIVANLSQSPTFPRDEAVRFSIAIEVSGTKKELGATLDKISGSSAGTGVFARPIQGKLRQVELSVYCLANLLGDAVVRDALDALAHHPVVQGRTSLADGPPLATPAGCS